MNSTLAAALSSLLLTASLSAQGGSIAQLNYGTKCRFMSESSIGARWDRQAGTLAITVEPSFTCCNVYVSNQWLLFGTRLTPGFPLDFLGFVPGCELAVQPIAAFARVTPGSNTWVFTLPPLTIGDTFDFQGVTEYFTTIGFDYDYQTSDGLRIVVV